MKTYTVLGLYEDEGEGHQRFGTTVQARDVEAAEAAARREASASLLIAGVVEGEFMLADVGYEGNPTYGEEGGGWQG